MIFLRATTALICVGVVLTGSPSILTSPANAQSETAISEEEASVDALANAQTENTRAIALEFLQMLFVERDVRNAYDTYAAEDMVQHNPHMTDGLQGHRDYFAQLESERGDSTDWANVNNMVLVDGDLFALHHHAFTGAGDPGRVFVDIWRVADGKIAEHWDVVMPIPAEMAHDNGIACGDGNNYPAAAAMRDTISEPTCGFPDGTASRGESLAVLDDYSRALFSGDVEEAIERFFNDDYRQHSPIIADGKQGAIEFLRDEFGKGVDAMPQMGPMRTIAEGDFVMMHRLTDYADGSHTANIDVFRIANGRIAEHWDLKQAVPDIAANENTMW